MKNINLREFYYDTYQVLREKTDWYPENRKWGAQMDTEKEKIAKGLKEARMKKGISQSDVAKELGITRQTISKWERCESVPDLPAVLKLSKIYGVSVEEMFNDSDDGQESNNVSENPINEAEEKQYIKYELKKSQVTDETNHETTEQVLLAAMLVISAVIPVLGIVVPIGVIVWNRKNKKRYKIIVALSALCLVFGGYNTYIFFDLWFSGMVRGGIIRIE